MAKWNVNVNEWSTIDDQFQTEDGKSILEGLGLEYGNDFRFREKFANDANAQLQNTENLVGLQDMIINDLISKKNEILSLQNDWLKVGTDAGLQNIKDLQDIKAYMLENRDRFGIDKDKTAEDISWADDTNQLAKAFMKMKDSSTDEYGFAMASPTDAMLKAAGLSTKEGTRGIPVSVLEKQDLDFNMNANFLFLKNL